MRPATMLGQRSCPAAWRARLVWSVTLAFAAGCRGGNSAGTDSATLDRSVPGLKFHVAILGAPADPRMVPEREALDHWNNEFARLRLRIRFDSGTIVNAAVPEVALRAASAARMKPWSPVTDYRLRK